MGELSHNNRITRFRMMCRIVLGCAQHKHPEYPVVARECTRVTASKCLIVSRQRCLASDVLAIAKNNVLASKYLNIICGGGLAIVGDAQGGKVWYLATSRHSNTGRQATLIPTVKLSNCQTFLSSFLKIPRASPPRLNKLLSEDTRG